MKTPIAIPVTMLMMLAALIFVFDIAHAYGDAAHGFGNFACVMVTLQMITVTRIMIMATLVMMSVLLMMIVKSCSLLWYADHYNGGTAHFDGAYASAASRLVSGKRQTSNQLGAARVFICCCMTHDSSPAARAVCSGKAAGTL